MVSKITFNNLKELGEFLSCFTFTVKFKVYSVMNSDGQKWILEFIENKA